MKVATKTFDLFLDAMNIKKNVLKPLEDAYYEAYEEGVDTEATKEALCRLESAERLVEALLKAEEELGYLIGEEVLEG